MSYIGPEKCQKEPRGDRILTKRLLKIGLYSTEMVASSYWPDTGSKVMFFSCARSDDWSA